MKTKIGTDMDRRAMLTKILVCDGFRSREKMRICEEFQRVEYGTSTSTAGEKMVHTSGNKVMGRRKISVQAAQQA